MFSNCSNMLCSPINYASTLDKSEHLEHKPDDQDIASVRGDVLANFHLMINYPNEVLHEKVMSLLNYLVEFVATQLNDDSSVMIQKEKLAQAKDYYDQLSTHILFDNYPANAFNLVDFDHMISVVQIQKSFFRDNIFPECLLNLLNFLPKNDLHTYFSVESLQILQAHGIDATMQLSVNDKLNFTVDKFLRAKRIPPLNLLHLVTNLQLERLQLELGIRPIISLNGCRADFIFKVLNDHFKKHDGINKNNLPVEILFNLAVCYRDGIGVDVNDEEAMKLLIRCASSGYQPAMSVLIIGPVKKFIENEKLRIDEKISRLEEAFRLVNFNVDACNLLAAYYLELSVRYSRNNESSKGNNSAEINVRNIYESAAFFGNDLAAFEYADILERGSIFPKNIKLAMDYYECAASLGNSDAAFKLGCMYNKNKDRAKSMFWYKKAMDLGSEPATIKLFKKYCRDFDKTRAHDVFLISINDFKEIIKSLMKIIRLNPHIYDINVLLLNFIREHPELKVFIRTCEIESYAYKLKEVPLKIRQNHEFISAEYITADDLESKESPLATAQNQRFMEYISDDSLVFILPKKGNVPAHLIPFETVTSIFATSNGDYGDEFKNPHTDETMRFTVLRNLR